MKRKYITPLLRGMGLAVILSSAGCRDRGDYHDPYYNDDHPRAAEQPYYNRWEQETHRQHEDLDRRSQDEQKQYYQWRHRQR